MNEYNERGERHGYWVEKFPYNIQHKGLYINGKAHGQWKSFHIDGATKSCIGWFNMDKVIGFWQYFDRDEKVYETVFHL
jgi:antitoxin component YwqK of YwqJK toxin-antitoxin module